DVLHDQEGAGVTVLVVVDGHHSGVPDGRQCPGLDPEPVGEPGFSQQLRTQHLHRHDPPERLVGGAPDLTHATATDQAVQPEAAGKQLPRARHPAVSSSPAKAGPAYRRPVSGVPRPRPAATSVPGAGRAVTSLPPRTCPACATMVPMAAWRDIEQAEPRFARRVRELFDARKHKTIATLRADGSPRISGIEATFKGGELVFGSMPGSRKSADLLRDPRFALHSATIDPTEGAEAQWPGEA